MLVGLVSQRMAYAHLMTWRSGSGRWEVFPEVLSLPKALNKDQVLFELAKLEEAGEDYRKSGFLLQTARRRLSSLSVYQRGFVADKSVGSGGKRTASQRRGQGSRGYGYRI